MAKKKRETKRKEIRKSLVEQLKNKGADIPAFMDQVEDYMRMWDQKEDLAASIPALKKIVEEIDAMPIAQKEAYFKMMLDTNKQILDTIKQQRDTNRQQLAMLKAMDITTDKVIRTDGDDSDDL